MILASLARSSLSQAFNPELSESDDGFCESAYGGTDAEKKEFDAACAPFADLESGSLDDVYETAFGDGVQVTVDRDLKVSVDSYDCGY